MNKRMEIKLELKPSNIRVVLKHQFYSFLIFIPILFLMWDRDLVFFTALGIFIFDYLPAFILLYTYWNKNKNDVFGLTPTGVIKYEDDNEIKYKSEDIDNVTLYLPPNKYAKTSMQSASAHSYYFAKVVLKSGESIYLTCLLSERLQNSITILKGVKINRKKRIIPFLY